MDWLEATCLAENFWEDFLEDSKVSEPLPRLVIPQAELKEEPRPRNFSKHWGIADDMRLKQLVESYDSNWPKVAEHFPGQSVEALQTRWMNKLDPLIKRTRWTAEEDSQVVKLYTEHGGNWKLMAQRLPGRPPNAIKTRYYGALCKVGRSRSFGAPGRRERPKNRARSVHAEESVASELEKLDAEWIQQLSTDLSTIDIDALTYAERQEKLEKLTAKMSSVEKLLRKAETQMRGLDS